MSTVVVVVVVTVVSSAGGTAASEGIPSVASLGVVEVGAAVDGTVDPVVGGTRTTGIDEPTAEVDNAPDAGPPDGPAESDGPVLTPPVGVAALVTVRMTVWIHGAIASDPVVPDPGAPAVPDTCPGSESTPSIGPGGAVAAAPESVSVDVPSTPSRSGSTADARPAARSVEPPTSTFSLPESAVEPGQI